MSLIENMKIFMPLTPDPPSKEIENISNALQTAISIHIIAALSPGLGSTFLSLIPQPTIFLSNLATYLTSTIDPILSTALAAQSTLGSIGAWASVQPTFDALMITAPPFMPGPSGLLFWSAILTTIRLAISIPIE